MLCFDIQALEARAAAVDGELPADDAVWQEGDPRPDGPLRVHGRLSTAGPDRFYFRGHVAGTAQGECRRCLTEVRTPLDFETHVVFSADAEDADGEADAHLLDPADRDLDLRPAVREEWLLRAPAFPLCRDDCAGLCPRCGGDRNVERGGDGACTCTPESDARWDALRSLSVS